MLSLSDQLENWLIHTKSLASMVHHATADENPYSVISLFYRVSEDKEERG